MLALLGYAERRHVHGSTNNLPRKALRAQPRASHEQVQHPGRRIVSLIGQAEGSPMNGDSVACLQRSEEHTSELQSLMRISYAVFCLKKKTNHHDFSSTPKPIT